MSGENTCVGVRVGLSKPKPPWPNDSMCAPLKRWRIDCGLTLTALLADRGQSAIKPPADPESGSCAGDPRFISTDLHFVNKGTVSLHCVVQLTAL